jgi:5-methylcytosine-specific restriction endonuclease McrA
MASDHISPTKVLHQCQHCAVGFYPKTYDRVSYCSRDCAYAAQKAKAAAYAIVRVGPHRRVWFKACNECGQSYAARSAVSVLCSNTCRARQHNKTKVGTKPSRKCKECGEAFQPQYGNKSRVYCSESCQVRSVKRIARKLERARFKAAKVETVNPTAVFERDGWRCQICLRTTPRRLRGLNKDRSPELDHIVPLSKGGEHSYRNTQCACRRCNGAKGATVYGQVPLFPLINQ